MTEFNPPNKIQNLKDERLWSLDWATATFPDAEFAFFICEKTEAGYNVHGVEMDSNDAFNLRRRLADSTGKKLFIRARKLDQKAPVAPQPKTESFDDEAYDRCRDYYSEGFTEEQVPAGLRDTYSQFLAQKINSRQAYRAGTRGGVDKWVQ